MTSKQLLMIVIEIHNKRDFPLFSFGQRCQGWFTNNRVANFSVSKIVHINIIWITHDFPPFHLYSSDSSVDPTGVARIRSDPRNPGATARQVGSSWTNDPPGEIQKANSANILGFVQ
jgi:hypothetical protein